VAWTPDVAQDSPRYLSPGARRQRDHQSVDDERDRGQRFLSKNGPEREKYSNPDASWVLAPL
jgi:hypothetical protein